MDHDFWKNTDTFDVSLDNSVPKTNHTTKLSGFDILTSNIAPGTFHDSDAASDAPKCRPSTRTSILESLKDWARQPTYEFPIKWLHNSIGEGITDILRSTAQVLALERLLVGSFFFKSQLYNEDQKKKVQCLVATLAYQLALKVPEAKPYIEEAVKTDPSIFSRGLEEQMQALIIDPLVEVHEADALPASYPRVFVIDGLDECGDHRQQQEILSLLVHTLRQLPVPFAFLVASRPEDHIRRSFDTGELNKLSSRLSVDHTHLPDTDINKFYQDKFKEIQATHASHDSLPSPELGPWPDYETIEVLVNKASGQLIYASTVIKFVSSVRHNPLDRLGTILDAFTQHITFKPFQQLDLLYSTIFHSLESDDLEHALRILGALLVHNGPEERSPRFLEDLLGFEAGDVEDILQDLDALLLVEPDMEEEDIEILHDSLAHFLFDRSRSGLFFIDSSIVYQDLARQCIRNLETWPPEQNHYVLNNMIYLFAHAEPTFELKKAVKTFDMHSLCSFRFHPSGSLSYPDGLRILAPLFLESVRKSSLPNASTLYAKKLNIYKQCLEDKLAAYYKNESHTFFAMLVAMDIPNLRWTDFWSSDNPVFDRDVEKVDSTDGLEFLPDVLRTPPSSIEGLGNLSANYHYLTRKTKENLLDIFHAQMDVADTGEESWGIISDRVASLAPVDKDDFEEKIRGLIRVHNVYHVPNLSVDDLWDWVGTPEEDKKNTYHDLKKQSLAIIRDVMDKKEGSGLLYARFSLYLLKYICKRSTFPSDYDESPWGTSLDPASLDVEYRGPFFSGEGMSTDSIVDALLALIPKSAVDSNLKSYGRSIMAEDRAWISLGPQLTSAIHRYISRCEEPPRKSGLPKAPALPSTGLSKNGTWMDGEDMSWELRREDNNPFEDDDDLFGSSFTGNIVNSGPTPSEPPWLVPSLKRKLSLTDSEQPPEKRLHNLA